MHSGARLTATSMSPDGMVRYGVFTAGLQFDPSAQDTSQRVACLAFRCPVIDDKGRHNSTEVVGNISVPGHRNGCCFKLVWLFPFYQFNFYDKYAILVIILYMLSLSINMT